jgi:hypothetical protein
MLVISFIIAAMIFTGIVYVARTYAGEITYEFKEDKAYMVWQGTFDELKNLTPEAFNFEPLPKWKSPAPERWEYRAFNLVEVRSSSSGVSSYWSRGDTANEKAEALNRHLSEGWQLQGEYRGEERIWLKRRKQ